MEALISLDDAEKCWCQVYFYVVGHKMLCIKITNCTEPMFLFFSSVLCFAGPTTWQGANFRLGSKDELKRFIEDTGVPFTTNLDIIIDINNLYVVRNNKLNVYIVAANFSVSDQEPKLFLNN